VPCTRAKIAKATGLAPKLEIASNRRPHVSTSRIPMIDPMRKKPVMTTALTTDAALDSRSASSTCGSNV